MMRPAAAILLATFLAAAAGAQQAPKVPQPPKPPTQPATPAEAGGERAPIVPPFVPEVGAMPQKPSGGDGKMPAPYIAGARQFLVQPTQAWVHIAREAKPGDEIILPKGFHISQVIEGLQGTREKPIFIRSRDAVPAGVVCEDTGWEFRRCSHLVIENILFMNPGKAAILVDGSPLPGAPADSPPAKDDGTPWPAEITIRKCTIAGSRGPDQDAILVRRCSDVRIDAVRVDGWNHAAVAAEDARRLLVRGLMMVPGERQKQSIGIAIRGASGEVSVTGCSFNRAIRTGVSVGTAARTAEDGTRTAPPPVERMRIDRCIFEETGTPLEIVNVRDLVLSRATIVNPTRAVYSIAADAGSVEQVLIEKTIGFWFPGMLQAFSPHPGRYPASAVTLADNLWYSKELPTGWVVLGDPFGIQSVPQVTTIDPSIDATTLRAKNPDAVRFGAWSIAAPGGTPATPGAGPDPRPAMPGAPSPGPAGAGAAPTPPTAQPAPKAP